MRRRFVQQDPYMDSVWIGEPNEGLGLRCGERDAKGYPVSIEAKLVTPGLEARETVYQHYANGFDDLISFFADLEMEWRGWTGTKNFRSLENDLLLEASHDGHVWLAVRLRPSAIDAGWSASATIRLDPGEQLSQVVADLSRSLSRRA